MKKFCKIPKAISHQKLINFFNNENLKLIIDSSKGKDLNINDMKVQNPYKAQLKDLYSLYQIVFLNKRTTILEFGSGWSTLIFSVAMKKLKEKYSKQILKLRRNNKFEVFSVENEKKFLQISKKRIKKYFKNKNYIKNNFHFSNANMTIYNGSFATEYENLPLCNPDFIYIDGPGQFNIKKKLMGISTSHKDMVPIGCDILKLEFFLTPGTIILVDGRGAESEFLRKNLKRNWVYKKLNNFDQHLFYLNEKSWGKHNNLQNKFYSGDI